MKSAPFPLLPTVMRCLRLGCLLAVPLTLEAESIFLKDGKVHTASEMRRDGNFLFLKVAGPDGAPADVVTPLNQVERIDFGDVPVLAEARQMARSGDAQGVLEKSAKAAQFFRGYADVPGNQWQEVMKLRLPALAAKPNAEALGELQKQWTPTGDPDLDVSYRLLVTAQPSPDKATAEYKTIAQPGAGSLSAGISWLALGNAALENKQWKEAIRAFLSVEVFLPNQRLLQPPALLGAVKAFVEKGEPAKASALVDELRAEYPAFAGAGIAILESRK